MKISISVRRATQEAFDSVHQVERSVADSLVPAAAAEVDFLNMDELSIGTPISHPSSDRNCGRKRGTFSAKTRTCFVDAQIDYAIWVAGGWPERVDEYARVLTEAVETTPRTRLTDAERDRLLILVEETRRQVRQEPPFNLKPVEPISITVGEDGSVHSITFGPIEPAVSALAAVIEVPPNKAASAPRIKPAAGLLLRKLYRRVAGRLGYYEVWSSGGEAIEHWGNCGERGETRTHVHANPEEAQYLVRQLAKAAAARGYRALPLSRHEALAVEYPIGGFGNQDDLQQRHAIEDFLNEATGWLGLGRCDGGSTGSGSMEIFCLVVDFELAAAALARELATSPFAGYSRIYRTC
jgi:predicted DNA-binding WGR domain protein